MCSLCQAVLQSFPTRPPLQTSVGLLPNHSHFIFPAPLTKRGGGRTGDGPKAFSVFQSQSQLKKLVVLQWPRGNGRLRVPSQPRHSPLTRAVAEAFLEGLTLCVDGSCRAEPGPCSEEQTKHRNWASLERVECLTRFCGQRGSLQGTVLVWLIFVLWERGNLIWLVQSSSITRSNGECLVPVLYFHPGTSK